MNKVMYEINYHAEGDTFSHCTVTPITVIREGILPGCTKSSITAVSSDGHKFQGSPENYFNSEEEATEEVKKELALALKAREEDIENLTKEADNIRRYLSSLTEDQNDPTGT